MRHRQLAVCLTLIALVARGLHAQQQRKPGYVPPVLCPRPVSFTIAAGPTAPPTPDPSDFSGTLANAVATSSWNQAYVNRGFGHSFTLPPAGRDCCIWTRATLIVKVKALQAGAAGTDGESVNDRVQLVKNGASVTGTAQQPFAGGATVGQLATVTIAVPQSVLDSGVISVYVQDDTAVLSAELQLVGCCLR